MKITYSGCLSFAKKIGLDDDGLLDFGKLAEALNVSVFALRAMFKNGCGLGYDTAAEFYNRFGEDNLRLVAKFDKEKGESMRTFKAKYVSVGDKLL